MPDVTTVNELVMAYKSQPGQVAGWLRDGKPEITRGAVKLLRAFLGEKFRQGALSVTDKEEAGSAPLAATASEAVAGAAPSAHARHSRWRCAGILVRHRQREGVLVLGRGPSGEGRVWIRYEDGVELEIALAEVLPLKLLDAGD